MDAPAASLALRATTLVAIGLDLPTVIKLLSAMASKDGAPVIASTPVTNWSLQIYRNSEKKGLAI